MGRPGLSPFAEGVMKNLGGPAALHQGRASIRACPRSRGGSPLPAWAPSAASESSPWPQPWRGLAPGGRSRPEPRGQPSRRDHDPMPRPPY